MKNLLEFPRSPLKLCREYGPARRAVDRPSSHESCCGFSMLTDVQNARILGVILSYDRTSVKQPCAGPSVIHII